jgi:TolB-like protein/tRNA A-37 threonylcarbamoyl transferase component Bud32/Flp pilus assembly protein TadD
MTDSSSLIGQTISHYRIIEKIGAGGMGEVYRARDEHLDREVAIKVLPQRALIDEHARKLLHKEAVTLSKLNHSHIATIYDFDKEQGLDFLVMEYVSGETLSKHLSASVLSEKEVAALGLQIAQALEEAHEHGIIHRDLKPANIAITSKGQVKVLDFGLAKLFDPTRGGLKAETLTQSVDDSHLIGTLPYMAPEQVNGEHIDARADIWAAGCVLYEMATHQRPFREESTARLFDSILHQVVVAPRALNPRISPEMERIILKCLEKEPENRYQSAKELLVDLRRLSGGSTTVVSHQKHSLRKHVSKLAATLLIALALGTAYFVSRRYWPQSAPGQRIMLAVLPFENLSGDPKQEYFSDGLTEEMISQLGRWQPRRLGVIARTSATHYKGSKKRIDQIGHELGVSYILEGSVRREEDRVRITTELIHVVDQTPLWSETYERQAADVFAVQSEVASRIIQSLALELLPSQQASLLRSPTKDSAAHEAYLKGLYYLNNVTSENYERARTHLERAIELDSHYAPAYAALAEYYWGTDKLPPQLAMPKAEEYTLKSLQLDESLPEAHSALAGIRFYYNWDWSAAEKEFTRPLELNPSGAETHRLYSLYLASVSGADQAVREIRRAQQLDPLSLNINTSAGWVFNYTRQYDQAIEQCRKALEIDPDYVSAHDCLGEGYLAKGMFEQAVPEFRRAASGGELVRTVGLARAYGIMGKKNEARKVLDELTKASKQSYFPPYLFGAIHVALGENEQGLVWLEEAYTHRDPYMVHLRRDASLDPLRSDPRFQDLLRRMSFPQ